MNVDMKKVKDQMQEHWDMTGDDFARFDVAQANDLNEGWKEIVMEDCDDDSRKFYIEVNEDSEVWHFDWVH